SDNILDLHSFPTRRSSDLYEKNKYTFHGYLTSAAQAQLVCDAAKDLLVDNLKFKSVAIMSEDAAWTKPLDAGYEACLPKAGLKRSEERTSELQSRENLVCR